MEKATVHGGPTRARQPARCPGRRASSLTFTPRLKEDSMATHRPFRFGIVAHEFASAEAWAAKARRAEALGFSTFLTVDTVGKTPAPLPALAFAAAATRTLRVGTLVLANDFRNPVLL